MSTTAKDVTQVSGGMGVGLAVGIVNVWILGLVGYPPPPEVGVALGVIWTGIFNRLVRKFG